MGRVLENLEPKEVFRFFEELSEIPRPSYHEKAVSDYLVAFAKERGLEYYQDELWNVIMIKEASEGYEDQEPVILQGHMDMVCEKLPGVEKDMEKEGLDLEVDGDFVRAKGTTLGGDDGIAVAYALALLDSDTLKHPRLEFVCTVSEEVGMEGAQVIDCSMLKGRRLLNMDSEEEGTVLASCAGGGCAEVKLAVERKACSWEKVQVHVHGLVGGHSGVEINKGRAASQELMGRILRGAKKATDLRLVAFENGTKDNAISREGRLVLAVEDKAAFLAALERIETEVRAEYIVVDGDIHFDTEEIALPAGVPDTAAPLSEASTKTVITLLTSLPQGVQRMSDNVEGLVETSLNWGVATLSEKELVMRAAVRSSVKTAKASLCEKISWIAAENGASYRISGEYPAWEWVRESKLREKMSAIYREMFGKELQIEAIHAGVECGLLAEKIEHMDAISMGPDIFDIHTPGERLSISSTKRMYDLIVKIIETKD
uniref:aminoacyl-histidine dipeptidase n=1 Tax=Eubacterium cellulosolvens TaxID=29322 RepID=UPI0004817E92|nr:aminoacyl-histidine dipeptidase [[Eubacterium] cellulosolvens]